MLHLVIEAAQRPHMRSEIHANGVLLQVPPFFFMKAQVIFGDFSNLYRVRNMQEAQSPGLASFHTFIRREGGSVNTACYPLYDTSNSCCIKTP